MMGKSQKNAWLSCGPCTSHLSMQWQVTCSSPYQHGWSQGKWSMIGRPVPGTISSKRHHAPSIERYAQNELMHFSVQDDNRAQQFGEAELLCSIVILYLALYDASLSTVD